MILKSSDNCKLLLMIKIIIITIIIIIIIITIIIIIICIRAQNKKMPNYLKVQIFESEALILNSSDDFKLIVMISNSSNALKFS